MTKSDTRATALAILLLATASPAQNHTPNRLILKVDETVMGPFGGQRSSSCLRVYSDGRATYTKWWNSNAVIVDSAGAESRPEQTVSVTHRLADTDVWELSAFLESNGVKRLPQKFDPPHKPIDYFERVTVDVIDSRNRSKKIVAREYYVASLEEKVRYPSALILLMDRIDQIEQEAVDKGAPSEVPADCSLKE